MFATTQASAYQRAAGRYSGDAVSTASPAKLVVLLYDRLVMDLARARQAQGAGNRTLAGDNLIHAQDIVAELLSSLDVGAWEGGPQLARLYTWLLAEMVRANVSGDPARTTGCLDVAEELRQAWTEAEALSATRAPGPGLSRVGLTG